jgi:hypothetical protein
MRLLQNTLPQTVVGLGFGPDGRTLVAGGSGGFDVWNLSAGSHAFVTAQKLDRHPCAFVLDPLERWLYISGVPDGCSLYHLPSGEARRIPLVRHHVISVGPAADGCRVALSRGEARPHRLECWTIAADGALSLAWTVRCPVPHGSFCGLAFHPQGATVAGVEERRLEDRRRRLTRWQPASYQVILRNASSGEQQSEFGPVHFGFLMQTVFTRTASG